MRSLCFRLLVLGVVAVAAQQGLAQRVRVSYAATDANNQHKLFPYKGTIYATYTRPVAGTPQVHVDVSRDGKRWQTLGQVSRGRGPSTLSTLVVDGAGRVHVAWTQFDGPIGRVYYSRYDRRWSNPLSLSPPATYAGYPSMDVDSYDRLHLVWYGIRPASAGTGTGHGAIYEIYYVQHNLRWTQPEQISPGIPDAINPALAVDTWDRVHVVWFQSDGRAYQAIYRTRVPKGTWSPLVALTSGGQPSTKPTLAVDRSGQVHVVWERKGGIDYRVGTTRRWSAEVRLSNEGRDPTVGLWSRGVFVLWRGEDGVVRIRVFRGQWVNENRLGAGDFPNAAPWRPGGEGTPFAVWTAAGGFQVTSLTRFLNRR